VALVTGAARGIGRAIAYSLACRGAAVGVNYRSSQHEAETLAEQVRSLGSDCLLIQGDVSVKEQAHAVVQKVVDEWKRLDILVNNASITRNKTVRKARDQDWDQVISVNLNGTYHCTSAVVPVMIGQSFGRIINVASYVGNTGNFGQSNFVANTGGIVAFTKRVALELAKYNITANAVAPGFTCTEMLNAIPENILEQIKAMIPLGRLAMPEDIARAVVFLAADGDYITGQQININGGLYM
jgi:NAD(P)-dependent dehydrogenase (short-subunit alcohol dehydrogenase family)